MKITLQKNHIVIALMCFTILSKAQKPILVKDINSTGLNENSNPQSLIVLGSKLIFVANDGINGSEIWCTDSATNSTYMVKDIDNSSSSSLPSWLTLMGNYVYFEANDGSGPQLWRTDGTNSGTTKITNFFSTSGPGISSSSAISFITVMNNNLYFSAITSTDGRELWKSDGTTSGTVLVKDINTTNSGSPRNLVVANNILYFFANDGSTGEELWKSDGTTSGTTLVKDVRSGSSGSAGNLIVPFGNKVIFIANHSITTGSEPWISDGTSTGTVLLKDINNSPGNSNATGFTEYKGKMYFTAVGAGGIGRELHVTDGTTSGTQVVKDINTSGHGNPTHLIVFKDSLYFQASGSGSNFELWVSGGTTSSTNLRAELNSGTSASNPSNFRVVGDHLYFSAQLSSTIGQELWMLNGKSGKVAKVYDLNPGTANSFPASLTTFSGDLYYTATDGSSGIELWKHHYLDCDSSRSSLVEIGTIVSTNSNQLASGYTCFCDDDKNLLLGLKLVGTGAVIADNGIEIINRSNIEYFNSGDGFNEDDAYLWHSKTWNVTALTQPTSEVEVMFPFSKDEMIAFNTILENENLPEIYNKEDISFYKSINQSINAHSPINQYTESDVEIISNGNSSGINQYVWQVIDTERWNAIFKVSSFSGGGVGLFPNSLTPLPIENINLKATWINDNTTQLTFECFGEQDDIVEFEIYRSTDNINYVKIDKINASKHFNQSSYLYLDNKVNKTNNDYYVYYVLAKQNSQINIKSNLVKLNTLGLNDSGFKIYPNPSNGLIQIKSNSEIQKISIYSYEGKLVANYVGNLETSLDISSFVNGFYFVHIETESGIEILKLLKN